MKLVVSAALLSLALVPVAHAQTAKPAAAAAAPAAPKFSLDTPIEALVADPKAKAVIEADLPGLSTHPAFDQFKAMSLRQLQPMSNGALSDEVLKKVSDDLTAIK